MAYQIVRTRLSVSISVTKGEIDSIHEKSVTFLLPSRGCVTHTGWWHRMDRLTRITNGSVTGYSLAYGLTRCWRIILYIHNSPTASRFLSLSIRRTHSIRMKGGSGKRVEI